MEKPIKCDCGKLVAIIRDGKIYVQCKSCKRQVELNIEQSQEPTEVKSRRQ